MMSGLLPVRYSKTRIPAPDKQLGIDGIVAIATTKSLDWKYEQEERIIGSLDHASKTIEAKPHTISLFVVPHSALREIVIGVYASNDLEAVARRHAKAFGVPAFRAVRSNESFDVERVPIEV